MTTDQRIKLQIGEMIVTIADLTRQVEELQAALAANPPIKPGD